VYSPPYYREDDPLRMRQLLHANSFALLVVSTAAGLEAVHLPLLLHDDPQTLAQHPQGLLRGHVARANPLWRALDGSREALAVFSGPHAYVSPSMYVSAPQVPTWNYLAVHAYGTPCLLDDEAAVREHLHEMIARLEAGRDPGWTVAGGGAEEYFERIFPGLVAFELPIARMDGKRKLNQNKQPADRAGVVAGLCDSPDSGARAIAALIAAELGEPATD
jgi:transcriptional regulator